MNVKITQPDPDIAGDLTFTQPKYHFGQVIEDSKGCLGFIIGMEFSGEWKYTIVYYNPLDVSRPLVETEIAEVTITVVETVQQALLGSHSIQHK